MTRPGGYGWTMADEGRADEDMADKDRADEQPVAVDPGPDHGPDSGSASGPEPSAPVPVAETGYTESGVPTLEGVREKIEARYGTALGHTELAAETPEARDAEERYEARKQAAAERLAQIRESMHRAD